MTPATIITFEGESKPIIEWALDYGITPAIIIARLKRGDTITHAITAPMKVAFPGQKLAPFHRSQGRKLPVASNQNQTHEPIEPISLDGKSVTLKEWAEHTGLPYSVLYYRLRSGWTIAAMLNTPVGAKRPDALQDESTGGGCRLASAIGTGAGSHAQERAELRFSNMDTEAR